MVDPQQHSHGRNIIEGVLRYLPGFRGYLEKDYRQESDRLARTHLANRLQQGQRALDSYLHGLVTAGQIDDLAAWERVKIRLEGLILQLRGAVRGYSGFFDYVRVDVGLLNAVYEHDMSLLQDGEKLVTSLEQLATQPGTAAAAAPSLLRQVEALEGRFQHRGELLRGLGS